VQPQFGLWELVVAIGGFFGALTVMGLIAANRETARRLTDLEKGLPEKYISKEDYRSDTHLVRNDLRLMNEKIDRMLEKLFRENNR
jgi:hypothetical protein